MADPDAGKPLPSPTMPCPDCGGPVVLDARALFAGQPARCPVCGLQLQLDLDKPRKAERMLGQAEKALAKLKAELAEG